MKLDDYGDSFSTALKNYLQKEYNHDINAKQAQSLAKSFSISDAIKLSDAVENNDMRVIRNILLDKLGVDEAYGVRPGGATPSTTDAEYRTRVVTGHDNCRNLDDDDVMSAVLFDTERKLRFG